MANLLATVLPMLPLLATFELRQTSYGAPLLFTPGVSTRISMLTSLMYSGTIFDQLQQPHLEPPYNTYRQRTQQQNSPPSSPCDPDSACGTQAAYPKQ